MPANIRTLQIPSPHLLLISVLLSAALSACGGSKTSGLVSCEPLLDPEQGPIQDGLVAPDDLSYLGAFRLPGDEPRPNTFEYGGNAMAFRPGASSGSLFITGHDRIPYGELPGGSRIAEVSIPEPLLRSSPAELNQAAFLQDFTDVSADLFPNYNELPRIGLAYLSHPATGPRLHLAWGQHFHEEPLYQGPTHAMLSPDLSAPDTQGAWFIGDVSLYSVNGYLFDIPSDWAAANTGDSLLATGRFRDGGWSGMGPALFAYVPWINAGGTLPASGERINEVALLNYQSSSEASSIKDHALDHYQHPDEWEGGAWITTAGGKSAVVFVGTKGRGDMFWYGFLNPEGADRACVETGLIDEFTVCVCAATGASCHSSQLTGCRGHSSERGWWSSRFSAQMIFYDPADLARVASGELDPHEPQPYARLDLDSHLFLNPDGVETDMLGTGAQRRYRIGDIAYDRGNERLYVLELFADGTKPVVHVFGVE